MIQLRKIVLACTLAAIVLYGCTPVIDTMSPITTTTISMSGSPVGIPGSTTTTTTVPETTTTTVTPRSWKKTTTTTTTTTTTVPKVTTTTTTVPKVTTTTTVPKVTTTTTVPKVTTTTTIPKVTTTTTTIPSSTTTTLPWTKILPTGTSFQWSGQTWSIRESSTALQGPNDNYFSSSSDSVFTDTNGKLHLNIRQSGTKWYAAEVELEKTYGYGTYTWVVESPLNTFDPSAVLGMFTYGGTAANANGEIDIEISGWDITPTMAQFCMQPYTYPSPSMINLFPVTAMTTATTHQFTWKADRVDFASWKGTGPKPATAALGLLSQWSYTNTSIIPKTTTEHVLINLYLVNGGTEAPALGKPIEILMSSFKFTP